MTIPHLTSHIFTDLQKYFTEREEVKRRVNTICSSQVDIPDLFQTNVPVGNNGNRRLGGGEKIYWKTFEKKKSANMWISGCQTVTLRTPTIVNDLVLPRVKIQTILLLSSQGLECSLGFTLAAACHHGNERHTLFWPCRSADRQYELHFTF